MLFYDFLAVKAWTHGETFLTTLRATVNCRSNMAQQISRNKLHRVVLPK